ncbi:MAG: radical SAM protein [Coriobacteriia bacterium]|nr:radical SAM protein [Coriobacteriia bacterium]
MSALCTLMTDGGVGETTQCAGDAVQKVMLVDPSPQSIRVGTFLRHARLEPLGLEYLAAVAVTRGFKTKVVQVGDRGADWLLGEIMAWAPSTVGFSVPSCAAVWVLEFCRRLKESYPNVTTVLGGYHPTFAPEIAAEPGVDYVIVGEGENAFGELLEQLRAGNDPSGIPGLVFSRNGTLARTPPEQVKDLDSIPFPLRSNEFLSDSVVGGLVYPPPQDQKSVAYVMTSRGCPHGCTYCCSPLMWQRRVRNRSVARIAAEIRTLQAEFGTNMLFFGDLTFNLSRKRVLALSNELSRLQPPVHWHCLCRPDLVDEELVEAMASGGCTKISFGVESLNPATLARIKPGQSIDPRTVRKALAVVQESAITCRAFFMIGFPWETKVEIEELRDELPDWPIDELRVGILTPLPGSQLYDDCARDGLISGQDYEGFTTEKSVICLSDLTADELHDLQTDIFTKFYQSRQYQERARRKMLRYPHLAPSYKAFFTSLVAQGFLVSVDIGKDDE